MTVLYSFKQKEKAKTTEMENFQIFPGYMHVIMYNIIVV
jgi:hypothetical protein